MEFNMFVVELLRSPLYFAVEGRATWAGIRTQGLTGQLLQYGVWRILIFSLMSIMFFSVNQLVNQYL